MKKEDLYNNLYMDIAKRLSNMSYCHRRKVGALIVKENRIISMGWNGTPAGDSNDCEEDGITKPEVLHAEANAIAKLTLSSETALNGALYITTSPCMECSKLIFQSGIQQVFYADQYTSLTGIEFLIRKGIMVKIVNYKEQND
jgi:dCMP deaminase